MELSTEVLKVALAAIEQQIDGLVDARNAVVQAARAGTPDLFGSNVEEALRRAGPGGVVEVGQEPGVALHPDRRRKDVLGRRKGDAPAKEMTATDALYGFVAWLTSREGEVTLSGHRDTTPGLELLLEFIKVNGLPECSPAFPETFVMPEEEEAEPQTKPEPEPKPPVEPKPKPEPKPKGGKIKYSASHKDVEAVIEAAGPMSAFKLVAALKERGVSTTEAAVKLLLEKGKQTGRYVFGDDAKWNVVRPE